MFFSQRYDQALAESHPIGRFFKVGMACRTKYEKRPIASDSGDKKRMYKAEARASRNMKAEKSKRGTQGRSFPYRTRKQPERSVSNVQT